MQLLPTSCSIKLTIITLSENIGKSIFCLNGIVNIYWTKLNYIRQKTSLFAKLNNRKSVEFVIENVRNKFRQKVE
jgi:hypothetical protein